MRSLVLQETLQDSRKPSTAGRIVGIASHGDFRGIELDDLDEETGIWERICNDPAISSKQATAWQVPSACRAAAPAPCRRRSVYRHRRHGAGGCVAPPRSYMD